jgi:hypothetical protein
MGRMANVKLLLRSAMIFFGTLMAAGLVALGAPPTPRVENSALHQTSSPTLHALADFARPWVGTRPAQRGR